MLKNIFITLFTVVLLFASIIVEVKSCTVVVVSRGASTDGSVMTSYLYDVAGFVAPLQYYAGGEYEPGDSLKLYGFREGYYMGKIAQAERTYGYVGNMNEKQVAITETTFTGREELHGGDGLFDYGNLMWVTLQRAGTAREAIKIMDELVRKYGYKDTGETFSIVDKNEAWVMDFIGKGEHGKGAVWVAARVPDGYIAANANQARIRQVDWDDTENWMWSEDVVDFAREMGWFDGPKEEFSFVDAYNPVTPTSLLLCEGRVWSVYRRVAPSKNFSADYWRAVEGAEPYPLFIKPDEKISVEDMIALVRDHFHDTPYYTGEGFPAGPFNNPYRWRPLFFQLDDDGDDDLRYSWERTISQPQTAFSFITQSRNWLPDQIGGICWYSVDDTYSNAFMPLYVGMNKVPESLSRGDMLKFDWGSAYWVFNLVTNYAYGLYNFIIEDIKEVQREVENRAHTMTEAIDIAAKALYETDKETMTEYLTDFSVNNAEYTVDRWRELGHYIFVKYNDRYKRSSFDISDWPEGVGYPEEFFKRAVEERPGYYDVRWRKPEEPIK